MRHFNELDHELQARLNRAYRPAVKYMESFSSPMGAVVARLVQNIFVYIFLMYLLEFNFIDCFGFLTKMFFRKLSFIFGGVSTVILLLFVFVDEDVAHIEHVLQTVSILALLAIVARYVFSEWNSKNIVC